jgi:GNAT superfamily N-acetyltransferase
MTAVDSLRGLHPLEPVGIQVDIQRAGPKDVPKIMELDEGLRLHVKGSPDFFITEKHSEEHFREWMADPARAIWLAYVDGEPVAFVQVGPASDDACTIIVDDKTTSLYGAFTREAMRGRDIATALLDRVLSAARSQGYERCAVDFEPMNLVSARFWRRHGFVPVCVSLLRYIDERVL